MSKHRCDDHLEDMLTTLFEDRSKFRSAWSTYWKCVRSPKGAEPPRVLDIDYDERMRQQVRQTREQIFNQRRQATEREVLQQQEKKETTN